MRNEQLFHTKNILREKRVLGKEVAQWWSSCLAQPGFHPNTEKEKTKKAI
jgi:hypothetical protein